MTRDQIIAKTCDEIYQEMFSQPSDLELLLDLNNGPLDGGTYLQENLIYPEELL